MHQAPPPTSPRQTQAAVAEQLVSTATQAITAWVARTREHGLPVITELLGLIRNR